MPGHRRTREEKARDLQLTAELYMKGWTQTEIANYMSHRDDVDYTLHYSTISRDLKYLRELWMEKALDSIQEMKYEELRKLDRLEREYWEAWENSLTPQESEKIEQTADGQKITTAKKESYGDPRFLKGIESCIQQRREVLGLDAPKRTESKHQVGVGIINAQLDLNKVTDEELGQLESILAKALPGRSESGEGETEPDRVYDADLSALQPGTGTREDS